MTKFRISSRSLITAAMAVATAGTVPFTPAFGQSVEDRALSDLKVDNVGSCSTLTVNFNIRLQMLSYFPQTSGRELHIRIQPLDTAQVALLREALRTPETVPALRSIEFEGDNPSGPVLSLFFTHDMRFDVKPGEKAQSLVIRLDEPGAGAICAAAPGAAAMPAAPAGTVRPTPPPMAIPSGLYTINLMSRPGATGDLSPAQQQAIADKVLYETVNERDAQHWHRLRIGFYETREQADAALAKLIALFPEAWVVKVSADERAQGVASRIDHGVTAPSAPAAPAATAADTAETARLTGEAEQAIKGGDVDRAIQLLTNATGKPENANTPRALELLGVTHERKGQIAHAQAEYEEYLRRYPSGEGMDRVRQRLSSLTASSVPQQLRAAGGVARTEAPWKWGMRGSFSQFYYRDQSTTKILDASKQTPSPEADSSVNLNQLLTTGDITISGGDDRRQLQLRAAGSYGANFGTSSGASKDIKSLTALYLDYTENDLNLSGRVGRQTRNSAGVLGRFDGALLGWRANPKLKFNLVAGFPVLSSHNLHLQDNRYFYGASVDVGSRKSPLQTTLYWFDQRASGGFIDRQAIGLEARYLKSRFNAFTIVDYDVKFRKLNLGLLTLNYSFPDRSNVSLTADYRQMPLLTTNNALIGQFPVTDLRGLKPFFTDPEIYQLAKDRTYVTKSLTATYSRPLTSKLQANIDFNVTDTGGYPASGGVDAMKATGREYYYGTQLIGTGLFWDNDIYILSGRYSDTQRADTYTVDFNARVPVSAKFRVSPRLRYGYRSDKLIPENISPTTFRQFQPTLRLNYYPVRHSEIEIEVGGNFSKQKQVNDGSSMTESGIMISAGYRLDF